MPGKLLDMLGLKRRPKPPPAAAPPPPPAAPPAAPQVDFRREVNAYRLGLRSDADPLVRSERFARLLPAWLRLAEAAAAAAPEATATFSAALAVLEAALEPANSILSAQLAECESRARAGEWEPAYVALQKTQAAAAEIARQEPAFFEALRAYFAAAPALPAMVETPPETTIVTFAPADLAAKRLSQFPQLLAALEVESELTIIRDGRRKLRSLHEELSAAGDEVTPGASHRRLIQAVALAEQIRLLQRLEGAFKPQLIAADGWRTMVARLKPTHREQLLEQRRLGERLEAALQHARAGRFAEVGGELPQCLSAAEKLLQAVAGPLPALLARLRVACLLQTPAAADDAATVPTAVEAAERLARAGELEAAVQTLGGVLPAEAAGPETAPLQPIGVAVELAEDWAEDLVRLLYDLGWNLELGDPRLPAGRTAWEKWLHSNSEQALARAAGGEGDRQLLSRTEQLRKWVRRLCPAAETPELEGLSPREAWEKIEAWATASTADLDRGNRAAPFSDEASAAYRSHLLAAWSKADEHSLAAEFARCGGPEGLSPLEQSQALRIIRVLQTDGE